MTRFMRVMCLGALGFAFLGVLWLSPGTRPVHAEPASDKMAAKQPELPPSVVGGKATTIAVYNFTGRRALPFWVDPSGTIQPVPDGKPVEPITGTTPFPFPTFEGATLGFQMRPRGGGRWIHITGHSVKPYIVLGDPPAEFNPPEEAANKAALAKKTDKRNPGQPEPAGDYDGNAFVPGAKVAPLEKNITNNNTTINNPRRRRPIINNNGGTPAPGVVVVEPAVPIYFPAPAAASTAATPPADNSKTPAEDDDDKKAPAGKKRFTAESPVIVEFLKIHNAARADVGVKPLEWSPDLANAAYRWAQHIAKTDKLEHHPDGKYGENMAVGDYETFTPATAANEWLAEKANYDPKQTEPPSYRITKMYKNDDGQLVAAEYDSERAHYTQMVWAKSTMVGVATAKLKSGEILIVAFYNPRGNIKNEKPY